MPLFKKDPNLTYTDLAIYIDNNIRSKNPDVEEKCFEYLWHLFYISAVKRSMFMTYSEYEKYALYSATRLYVRYRKEQEDGGRLKPIKSCKNYIKSVLYPYKVEYMNHAYREIQQPDTDGLAPSALREEKLREVRDSTAPLMRVEYEAYLRGICSTIKGCLRTSPYRNDQVMMHNVYLSCLLSLLNMTTMSRKNSQRVTRAGHRDSFTNDLIDKIYQEEYENSTIVYHLDKSMANYISTMVNKMRKEITKDLRYIIGSYEPTEEVLKDILSSTSDNKRSPSNG